MRWMRRLGYYINPLFSVFLGAVLLGERLQRGAEVARLRWRPLAVIVLTMEAGKLPLVALGLTVTWGIYAYLKKSLPIGPNQGFFLEVLILSPFALAMCFGRRAERDTGISWRGRPRTPCCC